MPRLLLPGKSPGPIQRFLEQVALIFGQRPALPERRSDKRLPAHGTARMIVAGSVNIEKPVVVNMVDISGAGLAVRASFAVAVDDAIMLSDGRLVIMGVVRHCTGEGKEFSIGIEIQPGDEPQAQESPYLLISA